MTALAVEVLAGEPLRHLALRRRRKLLRDVGKQLAALNFKIVNIDATIMAQAPRMTPHKARMIGNIAADL